MSKANKWCAGIGLTLIAVWFTWLFLWALPHEQTRNLDRIGTEQVQAGSPAEAPAATPEKVEIVAEEAAKVADTSVIVHDSGASFVPVPVSESNRPVVIAESEIRARQGLK